MLATSRKTADTSRMRRADAIDLAVGQRVRGRRMELKMSQMLLGEMTGVTFQQIQKYEKGVNRIGAGRLTRIAQALDVPPSALLGTEGGGEATLGDRLTESRLGVRLAQAFLAMQNRAQREGLVAMAEALAP